MHKPLHRYSPWLIVIAALLWAVDAPFRLFLTTELPSSVIVLGEHILICAIILPLIISRRGELKQLSWRQWLAVAFIGFGGSAIATVLFTQSFHYVNPSVAILLQKTQPFIAMLLAFLILGERLAQRFYLWAFVGIAGAWLISFPQVIPSGIGFSGSTLGVLCALSAAFLWGGSTVMGKYVLTTVSYPLMTALRFATALVMLVILAGIQGDLGALTALTAKDVAAIAFIALVAGLLSLWLYYRGLRSTAASVATIGELAFPLAAVVINWIAIDAKLEPMQLLGAVLLLFALTRVVRFNEPSQITAFETASELTKPV